jgi:hypothetical protein
MTQEEIQRKHTLLVTGYLGMINEGRIKYHKRVTNEALIEELEE